MCVPTDKGSPIGELGRSTRGVLWGKLTDVELRFGPPRLCKGEKAISCTHLDYCRHADLMRGQELYCLQVVAGRKKTAPRMLSVYGLVLAEQDQQPCVLERVNMFREVVEIGKEVRVFEDIDTKQNVEIM